MKAAKKVFKIIVWQIAILLFFCIAVGMADYQLDCTWDGVQEGDSFPSKYCIIIPDEPLYNGRLVIWAHGFQDAGTDVEIPIDQLCFDDICTPDLLTAMGFAFATNSYSKTGLAVLQGVDDILDLVDIFISKQGVPEKIYIVGASEGGLITTLLTEGYPDDFDAGLALCGPIGDFPYQINYLGDARATFEYFFPNQIPGFGIFNRIGIPDDFVDWDTYFDDTIKPLLLSNLGKTQQWVSVAKLPYDNQNPIETILLSAKDVLRYAVLNLRDAAETLGGFPFENRWKWYSGSNNDWRLNWRVKRFRADPVALNEMKFNYNTSGELDSPLITMHTTLDQQVPYLHEFFYNLKTIGSGSFLSRHLNIPIDRYGHCQFTVEEALASFALMLLYSGDLQMLTGVATILQGGHLESFEAIADQNGIPFEKEGGQLGAILNE